MSNKKLLFVVNGLGIGGAEAMAINLANGIQNQFEVNFIVLSENKSMLDKLNSSKVEFIPRKWRYDLSPAGRIRRNLDQQRYDLVVCFEIFSYFFVRLASIWESTPTRIILSIHSTQWESVKDHWLHLIITRLIRKQEMRSRIRMICKLC